MKKERQKKIVQIILFGSILLLSSFFLFYLWKQPPEDTNNMFDVDQLIQKTIAAVKDLPHDETVKKDKEENEVTSKEVASTQQPKKQASSKEDENITSPQTSHTPAIKNDVKTSKENGQKNQEPQKQHVQIQIDVKNILDHLDLVDANSKRFVPKDGILISMRQVEIEEGETAFSLLQRICTENGVALTAFNGYVRYIGNLGEFDAGSNSGWLYKVNGVTPSMGSNAYKLKDNDIVEWRFTVVQGDV